MFVLTCVRAWFDRLLLPLNLNPRLKCTCTPSYERPQTPYQVGDAHYARGFNARVNNRHLTFTGVGAFGDESYHIGDWISQVRGRKEWVVVVSRVHASSFHLRLPLLHIEPAFVPSSSHVTATTNNLPLFPPPTHTHPHIYTPTYRPYHIRIQVPCGHLGACRLLDAVKHAERLSYERHYASISSHQQNDTVGGGNGEIEETEDLPMEEWLDQLRCVCVLSLTGPSAGPCGLPHLHSHTISPQNTNPKSTATVYTEPFSSSSSSNNATTEQANPSYNYTAVGGAVPFTAQDLGHNWVARADLRSYRYSPVGAHVCSYLCWLAPVSV